MKKKLVFSFLLLTLFSLRMHSIDFINTDDKRKPSLRVVFKNGIINPFVWGPPAAVAGTGVFLGSLALEEPLVATFLTGLSAFVIGASIADKEKGFGSINPARAAFVFGAPIALYLSGCFHAFTKSYREEKNRLKEQTIEK